MLRDITAQKVRCVVVKDLSRFGRDYIDTGRYLERIFPALDVRFISVTDGIDSAKSAYDMLLPIKNVFNEQYARDISRKIQSVMRSKQQAGAFIGAFPSYGYQKSPQDKNKLIIDEYAASVVRRIFALYLSGRGKLAIAGILNREGILCPSEYKRQNGERYRNCRRLDSTTYWSYSTVDHILKNEMYAGNMVQGTKRTPPRGKTRPVQREDWIVVANTHDPIIDRETWEKTQRLLATRTVCPDLETSRNVFAGFLLCGDCGRALVRTTWKDAGGVRHDSLYCGSYKRSGSASCTPHKIPLELLHAIVLADLKVLLASCGDLRRLVQEQARALPAGGPSAAALLAGTRKELERIRRLKKAVYEDYRDTLISREEYLAYRSEYLKKEQLCQARQQALEGKQNSAAADLWTLPWIRRLLDQGDVQALDREIVTDMISQIVVFEDRRIRIIYNFSGELACRMENQFPG